MVSFERVFEVIDLPTEIEEKPEALTLKSARGALAFENVSFTYAIDERNLLKEVKRHGKMDSVVAVLSGQKAGNGDKERKNGDSETGVSQAREIALYNVSFTIEPGQLVALVGPSGAGKTTTTYLIPRLYDVETGSVEIDGRDVRDIQLESLGAVIGFVTQETYLFHSSIRENLQYARPNATEAELIAAARAAAIH